MRAICFFLVAASALVACKQICLAQLRLGVPERDLTILPGQTLSLTLTLTNIGRDAVRGIFLLQEVTFELVDANGPPGAAPSVIPGKLMPEADYPEKVINPGDGISTTFVLVYNSKERDYVFRKSGNYQLIVKKRVGYKDVGSATAKEDALNTAGISVTVKEPTGADEEVWEAIQNPDFARLFDGSADRKTKTRLLSDARALLNRYPASSYSQQLQSIISVAP